MKRDMDLIRNILLYLDNKEDDVPCWGKDLPITSYAPLQLDYHSNLLAQAGYIVCEPERTKPGRIIRVLVFSLTWSGQEYLDTIRDPEAWRRIKEGARSVGGLSAELLVELGKGFVRKKIKDTTGVDL